MSLKGMQFVFVALLAVSLLTSISSAFGVSGTIFKEEVSPGQKLIHEIVVSSKENDSALNMTADVYGFAMSQGGNNIELPPEEDQGIYTARPFLSVEPRNFTLEPGEKETILLSGTVPEDVGSGGRYAIVAIKTAPEASGNVMVSTAIEALVLLTIKDSELIRTGDIKNVTALKGDEGLEVEILFENTGNVHYKPLVSAYLLDEDGTVLAKQDPIEELSSVLPNNSRLSKANLITESDLVPGTYSIESKIALDDGTLLDSDRTTFEVE